MVPRGSSVARERFRVGKKKGEAAQGTVKETQGLTRIAARASSKFKSPVRSSSKRAKAAPSSAILPPSCCANSASSSRSSRCGCG